MAEFVRVVAWFGAVTTTVIVVLLPAAQVGRVQVTEMLALFVQVQPPLDGVTDTNVTPGGSVSVTVTLFASDGPTLLTLRLYEMAPAALTVAGPVLSISRSAEAFTVVVALDVLLTGTGSVVVEPMVTEFVSEVG